MDKVLLLLVTYWVPVNIARQRKRGRDGGTEGGKEREGGTEG